MSDPANPILEVFRRLPPPEFDLPIKLGIEDEYCKAAFVGSPWWDVIGSCLEAWDCLVVNEPLVFAYYFPAFAVAVVEQGYSEEEGWSGPAESFVRLAFRSLDLGSDWGRAIKEVTNSEERAAIRDWLEWASPKVDDIQKYWPQILLLLEAVKTI